MRAQNRRTARRQLDKRLIKIKKLSEIFTPPPRGWIKAIREALGMTTAQLGRRLGVSQPRVVKIEKSEKDGSITLETLMRIADALECQVIYTLVPKEPLEKLVYRQAKMLAMQYLKPTSHSMGLEAQSINKADEQEQLQEIIDKIIEKSGSKLWDDIA